MNGLLRRFGIDRLEDRARAAFHQGRLDEAAALYEQLVARPASAKVWFNYGLVHKFRHDWEPARDAFLKVTELEPGQFEGNFNLGIVATGLRDWKTARSAWLALDFIVEGGNGPPVADFGPAPIRLNATEDGGGEVVWGRRIDPCRARILSVPTPASGHRWDDVVLHDVVPRGERMLNGQPLAVFDELERMESSPFPTWQAELKWRVPSDATELMTLIDDLGIGGENWTENIDPICASCSLADAHEHLARDPTDIRLTGLWGLSGSHEAVTSTLEAWRSAGSGREASTLEEVG